MSWMKRQGNAPPPTSEHQGYAASQPYGNQQNMYQNYQGAPAAAQQQQMWQMPQQQPQYNQQYGQVYQQQPFVNSANQYFQQPQQYNQNYANQNFDNAQPPYQQNYYQNQMPQQQQQQQNIAQNEGNADGWEDNWNWGWEDSSKQHQKSMTQAAPNQPALQPPVYNNANVIEESFASTNNWNWSTEEKKDNEMQQVLSQPIQDKQEKAPHIDNSNNENNVTHELHGQRCASNVSAHSTQHEIKTLNDKEVVKEALPNLALGKRFNLENLTPQWSIESQMSQDSSDGPHTQSEGTYRSENQSRNSSKSSPGPNTDTAAFSYSQSSFNENNITNNEWSNHCSEESMLVSNTQSSSRRESCDELANSVQEMNITNHEDLSQEVDHSSHNSENIADNKQMRPPSISPNPLTTNQYISQSSMPPPPPVSILQVPHNSTPSISTANSEQKAQLLTATNITPAASLSHLPSVSQPPAPATLTLPPTTNFPTSSSQNPFKSAAPFSHKNISKIPPANPQAYPSNSGPNLTSPAAVNKVVQQERLSANFGANLETTPDNSERPDQPQVSSFRSMPLPSQVPDNLEIAPQNDRNQYLQTAHLSSVDYGENTDFSRNIPPSGLRRMGVGQQEVEYNQNLNISGDEPPPGLARMVPGQQTEAHSSYTQAADDYMDRQIDGQPTDSTGRPYRQADGQQTPDNYSQTVTTRGGDRRPVGLDRMVPGEPSNDEYPQYQTTNFASANEQRVVTGVDHDYPISSDAGPTDIREQNVDGSDYTEPPPRNPSRSIIGAREASNATSPDFSLSVDDQQREITMEGENLQDLSVVSSADIFSRDPTYDGLNANVVETGKDRNHDVTDTTEYPNNNSRRQSLNRVTSGEDSERDRAFKASPRKDRDKQKSSRDRDRDRDKERGRYSRGDRKYDRESERRSGRDERRPDKDRRDRNRDWDRERRDKDESPEARRHRRSTRSHRYETEDTDYYSDRERNRREGSYTSSKPPRGDDRERRRHHTLERRDDDRARRSERPRDERPRDERPRDQRPRDYERRYRDIDPRKYASLRNRDDDDRRKVVTFSGDAKTDSSKRKGETYSSGSRAGSREATATDEEADEPRRRATRDERRRQRLPRHYGADQAGAAWGPALEAQRRQYEYYERLRRTDPAAYMRIYKQLLAPGLYGNLYADGYGQLGYDARAEDRGSVHSGRSSANGLKPADTYYGARGPPSLRTELSDRELTTDMSLNLHLEESTVRSERMTPFKYSTAHVKGVMGARALVAVAAGWPVDGRAPALQLLPLARLLQRDAGAAQLAAYPGPLLRGATHKKSVVEYCEARVRSAQRHGVGDVVGYALLWDLLALMLRQNGVVVGPDVAELLMKNTKEFEYNVPSDRSADKAGSLSSGCVEADEDGGRDLPPPPAEEDAKTTPVVDEREALERYREYLIYGNRQEALEYAMDSGLWGHALQLSALGDRRARAAVSARFVASLARRDPLRSLYSALALRVPPAAADPRDGDWRPHAAILLANAGARPDHDRRTMTQLGDTLGARGLLYSAQFCYLSAGEPFGPHPLAPLRAPADPPATAPRLSLLLADPRATSLARFATNEAIFATEIYEYALSLSSAQQDYVLDELTVYKLLLATRLADVGQCERALRYAERAARALVRAGPRAPALTLAVAQLADRLKYYDPALQDDAAEEAASAGEDGSAEPSPRHQRWLHDLHAVAAQLSAETSQQHTPQHRAADYGDGAQYPQWDQTLQQTQQIQNYPEPPEDTPDYAAQYYQQHQASLQQQQQFQPQPQVLEQPPEQHLQQQQQQLYEPQYGYEEHAQSYADPYWQPDTHYGYSEGAVSLPGAPRRASADQIDRDSDSPKSNGKEERSQSAAKGEKRATGGGAGGGWLGGFLNKLSLRAPNQMILPDDTNPTIVWDEARQRWRDTGAADDAAPAAPPPPPALSTSTPLQSPAGPGAPPVMPVSNIFKMQKGRHIKKSYVDVLNPGARAGAALAGAAAPPAPAAPAPPPADYFVPAPQPVQVYIPSSPEESPLPTPTPPLTEGGVYDPALITDNDDFRSGI